MAVVAIIPVVTVVLAVVEFLKALEQLCDSIDDAADVGIIEPGVFAFGLVAKSDEAFEYRINIAVLRGSDYRFDLVLERTQAATTRIVIGGVDILDLQPVNEPS